MQSCFGSSVCRSSSALSARTPYSLCFCRWFFPCFADLVHQQHRPHFEQLSVLRQTVLHSGVGSASGSFVHTKIVDDQQQHRGQQFLCSLRVQINARLCRGVLFGRNSWPKWKLILNTSSILIQHWAVFPESSLSGFYRTATNVRRRRANQVACVLNVDRTGCAERKVRWKRK